MSPKEEPAPNVGVATVLSAGTRAVGELHSQEDLVLSGSFEGRLFVERALRIMPEARVEGEVRAERILVLGHTQGKLYAQQRIEIKPGAVVSGEVVAPQIRIHEGVILNARVHMSGPGTVAPPFAAPTAGIPTPQAAPTAAPAPATPAAPASGWASAPTTRAMPQRDPGPREVPGAGTGVDPVSASRPLPSPGIAAAWSSVPEPTVVTAVPALGPPRRYLVPALLRSLGDAPHEDIEHAERVTEHFLRGLGFELETRAAHPDRTGALRPIFRSTEPVPYATLRERLQRLEQALRAAVESGPEPPLQGTGTSGAHDVAMAMARLRRAALVVGPVALVRRDDNPGDLHLSVRVRRPDPQAADNPDPASLLLSLQKMQHELLDDLG